MFFILIISLNDCSNLKNMITYSENGLNTQFSVCNPHFFDNDNKKLGPFITRNALNKLKFMIFRWFFDNFECVHSTNL